jgi:hypothetical protein
MAHLIGSSMPSSVRRKLIEPAFWPTVLDPDVLAFNIANLR